MANTQSAFGFGNLALLIQLVGRDTPLKTSWQLIFTRFDDVAAAEFEKLLNACDLDDARQVCARALAFAHRQTSMLLKPAARCIPALPLVASRLGRWHRAREAVLGTERVVGPIGNRYPILAASELPRFHQ